MCKLDLLAVWSIYSLLSSHYMDMMFVLEGILDLLFISKAEETFQCWWHPTLIRSFPHGPVTEPCVSVYLCLGEWNRYTGENDTWHNSQEELWIGNLTVVLLYFRIISLEFFSYTAASLQAELIRLWVSGAAFLDPYATVWLQTALHFCSGGQLFLLCTPCQRCSESSHIIPENREDGNSVTVFICVWNTG